MGTETEYGIIVPGNPGANAMLISSPDRQRVRRSHRRRAQPAHPLGLRGGEPAARRARVRPGARGRPTPPQLTDEDVGLANVILTNGARFYVDHAHPEYSAPGVHQPARRARSGTGPASGSWPRPAGARRRSPNTPPINLYKNNTDNKGASYGTHENYLMRRETPFADIVRHLTPFFVSRQVVCRLRPGRHRPGRPRRRLPDLAARRLLRGRGRPRDHAEAPDHQHPRRAARRGREVPPAARHHRRRQPGRGVDLPQGRHDGAGAGDDRGQLPVGRPHRRPAGGDAARGVARPDAAAAGDAADRAHADRRAAADGVRRAGPQVRRGPLRLRRRPGDHRRAGPLGVGARPARDRPDVAGPRAGLGRQAADPRGLPDPRRAGLGVARGSRPSTCSTPTSGRTRGSTTGWRRPAGSTGSSPRRRSTARSTEPPDGHPGLLPRPLPGEVPGRGRRRVLGLGHLRPAGPRLAAAGADPGAAARDQGARRRPAGPLRRPPTSWCAPSPVADGPDAADGCRRWTRSRELGTGSSSAATGPWSPLHPPRWPRLFDGRAVQLVGRRRLVARGRPRAPGARRTRTSTSPSARTRPTRSVPWLRDFHLLADRYRRLRPVLPGDADA